MYVSYNEVVFFNFIHASSIWLSQINLIASDQATQSKQIRQSLLIFNLFYKLIHKHGTKQKQENKLNR